MHNTAETSKAAYKEILSEGKVLTQSDSVLQCIRSCMSTPSYKYQGGLSRRQIAKLLKMDRSTVAARVNKLIKEGYLESAGIVKDNTTKVSVGLVRLSETQLELI